MDAIAEFRANWGAKAADNDTGGMDLTNIGSEVAEKLRKAVFADDVEAVREIMDEGFPIDAAMGKAGHNALHGACANGKTKVALFLIEAGADVDRQVFGSGGVHPIHLAARAGDVEICRALIEAGAHVDPKTDRLSPIHWVEDPECMAILVAAGCDPSDKDYGRGVGMTALETVVEWAADRPADISAEPFAESMVEAVLDNVPEGFDVTTLGNEVHTLLHRAARAGLAGICERLVDAGFDLAYRNGVGQTASDCAWEAGFEELGDFLTPCTFPTPEEIADAKHTASFRSSEMRMDHTAIRI